jgi:hypothetical protein
VEATNARWSGKNEGAVTSEGANARCGGMCSKQFRKTGKFRFYGIRRRVNFRISGILNEWKPSWLCD